MALAVADAQTSLAPAPSRFVVGQSINSGYGMRRSCDYYELIAVGPNAAGSMVEQILLSPAADRCPRAIIGEVTRVSSPSSVYEFLEGKNPCAIAEQDLRRELNGCKNCARSANPTAILQLQCGTRPTRIRIYSVWVDPSEPGPRTSQRTSWGTRLLGRLNEALASTPLQRIHYAPRHPDETVQPVSAEFTDGIARGEYDQLFRDAPKMSELLRAARNATPWAGPTLTVTISPQPVSRATLNRLPILANGVVEIAFEVGSDGTATSLSLISGHPMLVPEALEIMKTLQFPTQEAGKGHITLEFKTNCPAPKR